jgi:hypothetical protein
MATIRKSLAHIKRLCDRASDAACSSNPEASHLSQFLEGILETAEAIRDQYQKRLRREPEE